MEDEDDFISCDSKRAHRRLKALPAKQQGATARITPRHKRTTPATATVDVKRPAITPKPLTGGRDHSTGWQILQCSPDPASSSKSAVVRTIINTGEQHQGSTPFLAVASSLRDIQHRRENNRLAIHTTPAAQRASTTAVEPGGQLAAWNCHDSPSDSAAEQQHCSQDVLDSKQLVAAVHVAATHQTTSASDICRLCPVCGCSLAAISTTGTGQMAHVNACLDGALAPAPGVPATLAATMAADDAPVTFVGAPTTADGATGAEGHHHHHHQQDVECINMLDDDITSWLTSIGAAEVADQFSAAEVDFTVLPHLVEHDLEDMGILDASLRCHILAAAAEHVAQAVAGGDQHQSIQHQSPVWQQQDLQLQDGLGWKENHLRQQSDSSAYFNELDAVWNTDDGEPHDIYDEQGAFDPADDQLEDTAPGHQPQAAAADMQQQQLPATAAGTSNDAQRSVCIEQQQQQQVTAQQGRSCGAGRPPLLPVQAAASGVGFTSGFAHRRRSYVQAVGQDRQQTSIAGWLRPIRQQEYAQQAQQAEEQQHDRQQNALQPDAKQQWQSVFNRPGKILAPAQPQQPKQRSFSQMQLGAGGQLRRQQQQLPPPADEMEVQMPRNMARHGQTAPLPRCWPLWRCLPGTNIIVDAFGQSSKALGSNRSWVLTHFHADHYMGLTKGFKQGHILCTPITAALAKLKLRVPESVLVPVPLGQEVIVEGTRLQFVDANHCPGAAMVVAHPPGGLPPVLHTGDARLTREATQQQPALQALVGKAILVLDTTYAHPAYCFPPQQDVLEWTLRAVQAESFNPRCLFLFGSYTIGKERLFLHVAQAMHAKVYVAAAKRGIMACIGLTPEQQLLLTTNHLEANIHVVPMRQVSLESMESLLVRYKGRYTAVVGFQPTGWTHTAGGSGNSRHIGQASRSSSMVKPGKRIQRGTVVLYKVPYSEHSSCAELREFVSWMKPIRIIPSVNNDNGPKLHQMMQAVTSNGRTTGPMDAFAMQPPQQAAATPA